MKSPLSFLTGLIRRRPVEPQPLLIGHDSPAKDSESEAQQAPIAVDLPLSSTETSHEESALDEAVSTSASIEPEVVSGGDADAALPADDQSRPPASDAVTVEANAPATPRTRRRPRAPAVTAENLPAAEIGPEKVAVEQPTFPAPAASDDAIALDTEISELRKQLTRKLELQNAQLKKMLERFGS